MRDGDRQDEACLKYVHIFHCYFPLELTRKGNKPKSWTGRKEESR